MNSRIITDLRVLRSANSKASFDEANNIIKMLDFALKKSATRGLGLAAPQIGVNKQVAIIRTIEDTLNIVNPVVISRVNGFVNFNEGCLSLPNVRVNTQRYSEIFMKDDLHPDGFVAIGDTAIVIDHEVDHLLGILVTDRAVGKNKIGRNDPCPCGKIGGNGKPIKWKKCHGAH